MTSTPIDNTAISTHLGKTSQYKTQYDPSLLVREPRSSNRKHLNIADDKLPFCGNDTWNAYEVSGLTDTGLPVVGVAKIVYPCDSKYIVESKSLKLYLNSFNMTKLGANSQEVMENMVAHIRHDLDELLETCTLVKIFNSSDIEAEIVNAKDEYFDNYKTLETGANQLKFTVYQETPSLLKLVPATTSRKHFHSALLKSNCRVTSQPDWGDVFISYLPREYDVDENSLLQYIVSFRDECHFHEEICETIYTRLNDTLKPLELKVMCLYARRGGIDINPERASSHTLLHGTLSMSEFHHVKTAKQ